MVEGLQFIHIHVPHSTTLRRIVNRVIYTFNFMDYYTTTELFIYLISWITTQQPPAAKKSLSSHENHQLQHHHHHMQLLILFRDVRLQNPSHQSHFQMSLQSCRRRYVEPTVQLIIHLLGAGAAFPSTTSLKLVSSTQSSFLIETLMQTPGVLKPMGFRFVCNRTGILQVSSLIVFCQDIHLPEMGFRSVCNRILQVSSLIVFCQDIHLPELLNY